MTESIAMRIIGEERIFNVVGSVRIQNTFVHINLIKPLIGYENLFSGSKDTNVKIYLYERKFKRMFTIGLKSADGTYFVGKYEDGLIFGREHSNDLIKSYFMKNE